MAQQTVSIGSSSNDGTGDPLRTAFTKVNENFTELYEKTGVDTSMTLQLSGNSLISTTTNTDIIIDPNGEGEIYLFGQEDFKISNSSNKISDFTRDDIQNLLDQLLEFNSKK